MIETLDACRKTEEWDARKPLPVELVRPLPDGRTRRYVYVGRSMGDRGAPIYREASQESACQPA